MSVDPLLGVTQTARKDVPAVKYALAVAGVGSAFAWLLGHFPDAKTAVIGTLTMFVLMLLMLVIARAATGRRDALTLPALAMTWTVVLLFVVGLALVVASIFFDKPKPFRELVKLFAHEQSVPAPTPIPTTTQANATTDAGAPKPVEPAPSQPAAKPCDPECRVHIGVPVRQYGPALAATGTLQSEVVWAIPRKLPIPRYLHIVNVVDGVSGFAQMQSATLADSDEPGAVGIGNAQATFRGVTLSYQFGGASYVAQFTAAEDTINADVVIRRVDGDN